MTTASPSWVEALDLSDRRPHEFFRSLEEISAADPIPIHCHSMRRAWQEMRLDGILCIDKVPVIYFKQMDDPSADELRILQRQLWNQSIVPILVIVTSREVLVYSGLALPARDDEDVNANNRLVDTFNLLADSLRIRRFIKSVELGEFFRTNPDSFDPDQKVDQYLLENLKAARDALEKSETGVGRLETATVHALLGRTIFTCYLVDRKIIKQSYFERAGADESLKLLDVFQGFAFEEARNILFRLFEQLQEDFNGDVFDGDLDAERQRVTKEHIDILQRFLNGDNIARPQRSLGFWAYDFKFIPIETISGIYESFLSAENSAEQRESGTYYTPRFLAEFLLDMAQGPNEEMLSRCCLDPACGSGIFLVGLFNQMAEEWRRKNPDATYEVQAKELIDVLTKNLYGVDKSLIACRIAAFSLYIALLDQLMPSDIQKLQAKGKFLPHLVARPEPNNGRHNGKNIFAGDFFDADLDLPKDGFNLILGNPPWVRPKNRRKSSSELWCKENKLPIPQRHVAAGFVLKAPRHLRDGGVVCFLLPAPMLFSYGKGIDFQRRWLSECTIEKVINLADMQFYLFPGSIHPALVVKYNKEPPDQRRHYIEYFTPKTEAETIRAEVLVISSDERKDLRLWALLNELREERPAIAWKETFWGTPRDSKFLERLRLYPALKEWSKAGSDNWKVNEGFNEGGKGKPKDRPILHEIPFLPTASVTPYVILEPSPPREPPTYEPRVMSSETIFRAPHVLFPHGVSRKGERIKSGFSSFDCSFKHAVRGIHADPNEEDELRFLTCVLASPIALYFFFHTSFNWAIDRPYILGTEYERFPFPKPATKSQAEVVKEGAAIHRRLEALIRESPSTAQSTIKEHQVLLDHLVFQYYDVDSWEEALIRDTVEVSIPSATPHRNELSIPALEPSLPTHRLGYMHLLLDALNTWAKSSHKRIEGKITVSLDASMAIVSLRRTDTSSPRMEVTEADSSTDMDQALLRLGPELATETTSMRLLRNLKIFSTDALDILKPLARRYWTETSALNDADEIAAAILTAASPERLYATSNG
jgi:type I restriction-modification system DNA methylase subunit